VGGRPTAAVSGVGRKVPVTPAGTSHSYELLGAHSPGADGDDVLLRRVVNVHLLHSFRGDIHRALVVPGLSRHRCHLHSALDN
jgi:hypothetical protein